VTEVVHSLVGYDRRTEKVAYQHDIPLEKWDAVRKFLHPDDDDPEMVDVYPLNESMAHNLIGILPDIAGQDLDYFIECSRRD
jgi:hypothetical protein